MMSTLLAATLAAADFSGSWVLNKAKSDFGAMPEQMIPDKVSRVHVHKDGVLLVKSTQAGARGEVTTDFKYKLDGTESVNKSGQGEMKTVAKLEGDTIVMKTERAVRDMTLQVNETYELAAGGKELVIKATIAGTPMGDIVQKQVFDRKGETETAVAPAAPSNGAAKPDFSGAWKLNRAKSNFGQLPEEYQPSSIARTVKQTATEASIFTDQQGAQGAMKTAVKVKLDGSESVNVLQGAETKSVAKWEGDSLSIVTKRDINGMALEFGETWTMNPDGKTMDVAMKIGGTPMGDILMKYVFEKE